MIRRPPRSTLSSSSAASDVYKRQILDSTELIILVIGKYGACCLMVACSYTAQICRELLLAIWGEHAQEPTSGCLIREHETSQTSKHAGSHHGWNTNTPSTNGVAKRECGGCGTGPPQSIVGGEVADGLGEGRCSVADGELGLVQQNSHGEPDETPVLCVDTCLLYTSDAADEEDSVDLGGRRIIKKKKKKYY
eukprot:TRINITY_DN2617_c0_g1_i17.p2 TRINITY_DN2617_c0_g1~~TRINITY_DN2617_c0_g1_i17.p2  ORF type:complete len:193 (-),score=29.10 TRINITY_DN2617_c0_g1_i17:123-701(-)